MRENVRMWLEAGVQLVWVVFPSQRTVEVYRADSDVVTLREGDALDGGDIIPGFSAPVARLFS